MNTFRHPIWLQTAAVWGVYGVGALVAAVSALLAACVLTRRLRPLLAAAVLALAAGAFGAARLAVPKEPRPELPVALELKADAGCNGTLIVELNGGARFRGTDTSVKLWLDDKARTYSLRCQTPEGKLSKPSARGNVRVLHDAGTRDLPPRAPTSLVDADGRGYTIYYQNQLPDVRVRWPSAPEGSSYQLDLDGKVLALKAPEHTFDSGGLKDGVHRLTFSAKERRSRTTTVEVRFDNTATTASLSAPKDRGFAAGAEVEIEGVLLPAWKVSLDGGMIEKVGEDRFHGRIVTTQQNPDFAVRLSHPRLGTHYYLRRAAGAP